MKNTALITGASNGIGLELAKVHASKGGDLVLVARNKSKLEELKKDLESQYKVSVYTIGKDLSADNSAQEVYEETTKQNIKIDFFNKQCRLWRLWDVYRNRLEQRNSNDKFEYYNIDIVYKTIPSGYG